jgi:hypothetical protein
MRYDASVATEVQPMALPMLVELVNGWGTVPRAQADARGRPPVGEFLARHAVAGALASQCTDAALERVADQVYPVFAATGAAERARLVTDVLTRCEVHPGLGSASGRILPTWVVPRGRDGLLAAAAVALHAQLVQHEPERLGTCASVRCGDAFVDASPGAHRRFCSVTCQNRERVAAFRRRRAAASRP